MKPYDLFISDFKQQEKKFAFIKKKKKRLSNSLGDMNSTLVYVKKYMEIHYKIL